MSRVVSVAPVLPGPPVPQEDITRVLGPLVDPPGSRRRLLDRVHAGAGVRTRHLVLDLAEYPGLGDFGATNALHRTHGAALAARAARAVLDSAGLAPTDVDVLLVTSVTGVQAPGLDVPLVADVGLRPDVRRTPSFGLGCAGGAAGLARLDDVLRGRPAGVGLLVAVETCSLTLQRGDSSGAGLVASGLFGDGAAAALMVGRDHPAAASARVVVVGSRSTLHPGTAEDLGWAVGPAGLRVVLSQGLPDLLRAGLRADVESLLREHDLGLGDVRRWVVHAGGPRILDAVAEALELDPAALTTSRESLAAVGNLSSASVLDVLHRTLSTPGPAGPAVLLAFGPGVTTEAVLLDLPEVR